MASAGTFITRLTARLLDRKQWPIYCLFVIALATGFVNHLYLKHSDPMYDFLLPGGDNHNYHRWAGEIAQTFWLGWDRIPFDQAPLYPYFLAFIFLRFGMEYDAAAVAQVVLGAVNVGLIYAVARRVFGQSVALTAGIISAFSPNLLLYHNELLPETLIVCVNLLFVRALIVAGESPRWHTAALAGFWLGMCAIGRPNALFIAPLLVAWLGWNAPAWRARLGHVVAGCVAMGATILPVTCLNYFAGGEVALITKNSSWNLYIGNAPDASGTYARPQSMWYIIGLTQANEADIQWGPVFWHFAKEDPSFIPRKLAKKTILFWQSGELPQIENYYLKRNLSPLLQTPLMFGTIAPLGLVGIALAVWAVRRKRVPASAVALALYVGFFSASIIITFVIGRLRLPAHTVLIIFSAFAIVEIVRRLRPAPGGLRNIPGALGIAVTAIALGLLMHTWNPHLLIRWSDYYNLGSAYEVRGDLEQAELNYLRALDKKPGSTSAQAALDGVRERMQARVEVGLPPVAQPD